VTRLLDLPWTGGLTEVPIALIINAKQPAVEGEDEHATDKEAQTADVAVGEGHPDPSLRAGAGGKWLTVHDAARLSDLFNLQEPNLIAEARWMAKQLGPALEQRDDRLVWALIDSGGPYWTLASSPHASSGGSGLTPASL
jgi:hypothetical protein